MQSDRLLQSWLGHAGRHGEITSPLLDFLLLLRIIEITYKFPHSLSVSLCGGDEIEQVRAQPNI